MYWSKSINRSWINSRKVNHKRKINTSMNSIKFVYYLLLECFLNKNYFRWLNTISKFKVLTSWLYINTWTTASLNNIDFSFVSFWENKKNNFHKKNFLNHPSFVQSYTCIQTRLIYFTMQKSKKSVLNRPSVLLLVDHALI